MLFIICLISFHGIENGVSEKAGIYYVHDNEIIDDDDVILMASLLFTDYYVEDTHPLYISVDGVLYSKDGTKLIAYPAGNNRHSYQIIDSCVEIGSYAFFSSKLSFVEFPQFNISNVSTIGVRAFWGCNNMLQICLPSSITKIGEEAFGNCNEEIIIIVENNTYCCNCSAIKSISNTIVVYDYSDVWEWVSLESKIVEYPSSLSLDYDFKVDDGVLFQGDSLLSYPRNRKNEEYVIPNGVISIQAQIFQNRYIQKLFIPSSCITIRNYVQSPDGCLEFINVDEKNPEYSSMDGVLYSKDFTVLYCYPQNKELSFFYPSSAIKTIASSSFIYCKVHKLVLPEGTQTIESFAFYGSLLEEIVIPITVSMIDIEAFENCMHLTHIYLEKDSYADKVFRINSSGYFENLIKICSYY